MNGGVDYYFQSPLCHGAVFQELKPTIHCHKDVTNKLVAIILQNVAYVAMEIVSDMHANGAVVWKYFRWK